MTPEWFEPKMFSVYIRLQRGVLRRYLMVAGSLAIDASPSVWFLDLWVELGENIQEGLFKVCTPHLQSGPSRSGRPKGQPRSINRSFLSRFCSASESQVCSTVSSSSAIVLDRKAREVNPHEMKGKWWRGSRVLIINLAMFFALVMRPWSPFFWPVYVVLI